MAKTLSGMRSQVTADWQREFPGFGVYKPMWLVRRFGPFVQGLNLGRSTANDAYVPQFHVHSLARPSPALMLSPGGRVRSERSGADYWVRAGLHENEVSKAVQAARNQSFLPLDRVPLPDEICQALGEGLSGNVGLSSGIDWGPRDRRYEDLVSALAWFGRIDEAEAMLHQASREMADWEPRLIPQEGVEAWLSRELARIADVPRIKETVAEQTRVHKLQKMPIYYDPFLAAAV